MIKVVKMNTYTVLGERTVYIGRGNARIAQSPLANPFRISGTCTREEAVASYDNWLLLALAERKQPVIDEMNRLYKLAKTGDLVLACYCKPLACHGDVIKRLLDNKLLENGHGA